MYYEIIKKIVKLNSILIFKIYNEFTKESGYIFVVNTV